MFNSRAISVQSGVTYAMESDDEAVTSFLADHQPYADIPIMHPHTRIEPFLAAQE